jgi:hypothetical protein
MHADPCVYFGVDEHKLILAIFVDDEIICSISNKRINNILFHMQDAFKIITRHPEIYMGLHIMRIKQEQIL